MRQCESQTNFIFPQYLIFILESSVFSFDKQGRREDSASDNGRVAQPHITTVNFGKNIKQTITWRYWRVTKS